MASKTITVAVSYFYNGRGWTDKYTGIEFNKEDAGYPVVIPKTKNLDGIKRSIRLNSLYLIEGDLDTTGVNTLDGIDPSELTNKQLLELSGSGSAETEELEKELAKTKADLVKSNEDLVKANTDLTTEKGKNKTLTDSNTALQADKTKLEGEKATLTSDKTKLEGEKSTLTSQNTQLTKDVTDAKKETTDVKNKMYLIHIFKEEELTDAYFTVAVLKEIMTIKSIQFETGDSKADLQAKLIAGQE